MKLPATIVALLCVGTMGLTATISLAASLSPIEELGKELFFDKISDPPSMSCGSCHAASVGWTGGIAGVNIHGGVYRGAVPQRFGDRKPPTTAYFTFSPVLFYDAAAEEFVGGGFWDGRATGERLGNPAADQALGPFLNPVEQNMPSPGAVCERVANSSYAGLFEEVWGPGALDCSLSGVEDMYDRIGLSIAAYEASTEVSPFSSKFDAYWIDCITAGNDPDECGLAEGEKDVLDPNGVLSDLEWDGLIEFGEYCSPCHVSNEMGPGGTRPLFTNFRYENIGAFANPENPFYEMDEVLLDDGSPINPLGDAFVDRGLGAFLRRRPEWAALAEDHDGKMKVPTVRNVDARPGPGFPKAFMHNGAMKSLAEVVHFYNTRDVVAEGWPPPEVEENVNRDILEGVPLGDLQLDEHAEEATVAFLGTLTDGYFDPPADGALRAVYLGGGSAANQELGLSAQPIGTRGHVRVELAASESVEFSVFNVLGQRVRRFAPRVLGDGTNLLVWDGTNGSGRAVPNGTYFYRLQTPKRQVHVKGVYLR